MTDYLVIAIAIAAMLIAKSLLEWLLMRFAVVASFIVVVGLTFSIAVSVAAILLTPMG